MSVLGDDMRQDTADANTAFEKHDIIRGLKLLAGMADEVAGIIAIIIGAAMITTALTGGLAALSIPISATVVTNVVGLKLLPEVMKKYENLDREERADVRKALHFLGIPVSAFDDVKAIHNAIG